VIRRLLFLSCAVLLLEAFFSAVLTPLVPGYRRDLGIEDGATGVLVASYSAGALLLAIPAGWFASRYNPRNAVVLGLVGVGVFSVVFGFADRIEWLDISRFFLGAFGALMWAGGISWMISSTALAKRGQVMGTLVAASVAGELVGPPVGALAEDVGVEIVFSAMLVLALLLVVIARTIPPVAEEDGQTLGAMRRVIVDHGIRQWLVAMLAVAAPATAIGFLMVIVPLRFDDLGISAWWLAAAFTMMSIIEAVGGPLVGRLSDRVGRKRPYMTGLVLVLTPLVLLGSIGSLWTTVGALVVMAVGGAFAFTTSFTLVTDLATDAGLNQGYSSAVSNIAWSGSIIVGAVGGGLLIAQTGYLVAAVAVAAIGVVIGLVCRRAPFHQPQLDDEATVAA
jgi:MFS family permease